MFSRKPGEREWRRVLAEQARIIDNLTTQKDQIWSQLGANAAEANRRYEDMRRDRDYWRNEAEGTK